MISNEKFSTTKLQIKSSFTTLIKYFFFGLNMNISYQFYICVVFNWIVLSSRC
jgi:hypothetical protein